MTIVSQTGGLSITAEDASDSSDLSGVELAVITDNGSRYSATTASDGVGTIYGLPDGTYAVYAYEAGYLPTSVQATVSGGTGFATVDLQNGQISATSATATPLDYQQILAAGINPNDPANYNNVYGIVLQLAIGNGSGSGSTVTVKGTASGCGVSGATVTGATQVNQSGGCGSVSFDSGGYQITGQYRGNTSGGSGAGGSGGGQGSQSSPAMEWFAVPVQAEWLKEFFDVDVLVTNLGPSGSSFDKGSVTLGALPPGLSLAPTAQPQSMKQSVGDIPSGESDSANWVLRGDAEGFYGVSATYNGTLDPGQFPISFPIQTSPTALQVWGLGAVRAIVSAPAGAVIGQPYTITITMTDIADVPVYNLGAELQSSAGCNFLEKPGQPKIETTPAIAPGQTWQAKFAIIPGTTGYLGTCTLVLAPSAAGPAVSGSNAAPNPNFPLTVTKVNGGGLKLSWTSPTVSGIQSYQIFYTKKSTKPFKTQPLATVPAGTTSTVISNGKKGYYAVVTVTSSGSSLYNDVAPSPGKAPF